MRRLVLNRSSDSSTVRPGLSKVTRIQSGAILLVNDVHPAAGTTAPISRPDQVRVTVTVPASPADTWVLPPTAKSRKVACGSGTGVVTGAAVSWFPVRFSVVSTPDAASAPARKVAPRTLAAISMMAVSFRDLWRLPPPLPGGHPPSPRALAFRSRLPRDRRRTHLAAR